MLHHFSLVFVWAGFVFLYINFFVGVQLASYSTAEFLLSNLLALFLYVLAMYPGIFLSVKHKMDFSEAVSKYFSKYIVFVFFGMLLINVGWFALQLEMIWEMSHSMVFVLLCAYLFVYGSYRWGFAYLKIFSILTISLFLLYLCFALSVKDFTFVPKESIDIWHVLSGGVMIFGAWAFSSTTLIMDVAKFAKSFRSGFFQLLAGLLIGHFLLVFLGYSYAVSYNIDNFKIFLGTFGAVIGTVVLFLNIWSTNDSNFYNSMQIARKIGINKKIAFMILPLLSYLLVYFYKDRLFEMIGNWLIMMGNVGLVMILVWWYIYIRERNG